MKIFYSSLQKKHSIKKEMSDGRAQPYQEKTARITSILKALKGLQTEIITPETLPHAALRAVHDEDFLKFLESSQDLKSSEVICPYVFPCDDRIRQQKPYLPNRAGYYCYDAGTSLMNQTWAASVASASAAYAAAQYTKKTGNTSYALCRPPGHHASKNKFGGYCYLNNAAIAAKHLSQYGKVMVIDFDYHHGNGTQSIFYDSSEVFYFSIHGHPSIEYPYFAGFESEIGVDDGLHYNLNIPLLPNTSVTKYFSFFMKGLEKAFKVMDPDYIVLSAGFDIAAGDPIGHFNINATDFYKLGKNMGSLRKKTVVVQEGGYLISELGENVASFLRGFLSV